MENATSETAVLHADPEHFGLRVVVFLTLIGGVVGGYFLIGALLRLVTGGRPEYAFVLSCGGALALALVIVWLLEAWLKRVWPSGRRLLLDAQGITAVHAESHQTRLAWQDGVRAVTWSFQIGNFGHGGRERRVPKRWFCLAVRLRTEDDSVTVYTFMPPAQARQIAAAEAFTEINLKEVAETSPRLRLGPPPPLPQIPQEALAGPHGRFWQGEKARRREGFELEPDDFLTFHAFVERHVHTRRFPDV